MREQPVEMGYGPCQEDIEDSIWRANRARRRRNKCSTCGKRIPMICVWLHRGVHPAIATRHSTRHTGIHHAHMWEWLPYNIYTSGLAEPWPKR